MYLDKMYFIGFTSKIAREELVDVPPVPLNYKDPIKIKERFETNLEKVRPLAEVCPGVSTVEEIHVYNYQGKPIFWSTRSVESPYHPPAIKFWEWLDKNVRFHFRRGHTLALLPETVISPEAIVLGPLFFGFRIKAFFSMVALEAIHYNAAFNRRDGTPPVKVPIQIWRDHIGVVDPYNVLFTPEQRKIITLDKAIQLLFGTAMDLESLYQNPRKQAILAYKLTQRGQLLGTSPEEDIGYSSDYEQEEDHAVGGPREEGTSSGGEPGVLPAEVQPS